MIELERSFLLNEDFLVKENANKHQSIVALEWFIFQKTIIPQLVREIFPKGIVELHETGWFHINKLNDGGLFVPYCGGFDALPIMMKGLDTPTVTSAPAKHLSALIDQFVNFIYVVCQERTGAIGLYGIDVVSAPYIVHDPYINGDYRRINQEVQRFVWSLNYPSRAGYQTPFTNISLAINNPYYIQQSAYVGGKIVSKLADYIDYAKLFIRALFEILLEGDAKHRPFTFPITTVLYNNDFLKVISDFEDLFWDLVRLRGSIYFMNAYNSEAFDLFSFCCRVIANHKRFEVLHKAKGIWVMPPSVGSIGYVTLNLPRIVAWSLSVKHEEKYMYDKLYELMVKAREALMILRERYNKFLRHGLYPITKKYLGDRAFSYYYNTIAYTGIAEAFALLVQDRQVFNNENNVNSYEKFCRDILEYINKVEQEFENKDGVLYNLEQAPAESTSYKFARLDWEHEDSRIRNHVRSHLPVALLYTSQLTPPYCTWKIWTQLDVEAKLQKLHTGGVVKLIFDHQERDREFVKKLIDYAMSKGVIYVAYTPTITHCENCGFWAVGIYEKCLNCGVPTSYWSRIVGYYRPTQYWNNGKIIEFKHRVGIIL